MRCKLAIMLFALAALFAQTNVFAATLTLPSSLTTIGTEAFYGDRSIGKIVLSGNVKRINARAFANSSITEINLPKSITYIDDTALASTKNVKVTATEGTYAYEWAVKNGYIKKPMELSIYWDTDLKKAAKSIGLTKYREVERESPYEYYNDTLAVAGYDVVEYLVLTGSDYSVYGVTVGMEVKTALPILRSSELLSVYNETDRRFINCDHASSEERREWLGECDSALYYDYNSKGIITKITWNMFTG